MRFCPSSLRAYILGMMGRRIIGGMIVGAMLVGCGGSGTQELAEATCERQQSCNAMAFNRLYESLDDCIDKESAFQAELYESEEGNRGKDCADARVRYDTCVALNADCQEQTTACTGEQEEWETVCD